MYYQYSEENTFNLEVREKHRILRSVQLALHPLRRIRPLRFVCWSSVHSNPDSPSNSTFPAPLLTPKLVSRAHTSQSRTSYKMRAIWERVPLSELPLKPRRTAQVRMRQRGHVCVCTIYSELEQRSTHTATNKLDNHYISLPALPIPQPTPAYRLFGHCGYVCTPG
jgi:hypothetical protein